MTLKCDAKLAEKLTCGLENDMTKSENWDFDGILLSKIENVRA